MTGTLADALDELALAARRAGLDETAARREGEVFAAAIAEHAKATAFGPWCEQTGHERSAERFMDAASSGRRYRTSPTPFMSQLRNGASSAATAEYEAALGDVAIAAIALGRPDERTVGILEMAMQAQRGASTHVASPALDLPAPGRDPVPGMLDFLGGVLSRQTEVNRQLRAMSTSPTVDPLGGFEAPSPSDPPPQPPTADGVQTQEAEPEKPGALEPEPEEPTKSVEELLAELDELIGLKNVKDEIHRQAAVLRVEGLRKKAGLDSPTITRHLVFNGNPGTGKTTVARLVAGIYRALGLLSKGQLVECDRSELVAGYLGQTAQKTADLVKSAEGGVLFIDEAYSLSGDQYGKEAIDTLVKEMEDKRDDLVVIVAGYPLPMAVFISENPGLESRFRTMIEFPNYTDDELVAIFQQMVGDADYDAGEAVTARLRELLSEVQRGPSFGNARYVRNMLEAVIGQHAWRLRDVTEPTLEQLRSLDAADLVDPDAEEPEPPAVAEDGTLVPPADAPPAEVVDVEPGHEAPGPTDETVEPSDETVPAEQAEEGQEES